MTRLIERAHAHQVPASERPRLEFGQQIGGVAEMLEGVRFGMVDEPEQPPSVVFDGQRTTVVRDPERVPPP